MSGERLVGGISVHLKHAVEGYQLALGLTGAAALGEDIADRGRSRSFPGAIVHGLRPELAAFVRFRPGSSRGNRVSSEKTLGWERMKVSSLS